MFKYCQNKFGGLGNTDFHCLMYLSIVNMKLEGVQNNSLHFSICACHPGRVPMLCSRNNKLPLKGATHRADLGQKWPVSLKN